MTEPAPLLRRHPRFHFHILALKRDVTVYLPPGYDDDANPLSCLVHARRPESVRAGDGAFNKGEHWRLAKRPTDLIAPARMRAADYRRYLQHRRRAH